jgi:hypothetical protein
VSDINLTNPIFHDEDKAREHFEKLGWPDGPFCPHCGETEKVYPLNGKTTRPGLHHCNSCDQAFTITVGSVMESSHLPLTKWALGFHLMASSKKGVSKCPLLLDELVYTLKCRVGGREIFDPNSVRLSFRCGCRLQRHCKQDPDDKEEPSRRPHEAQDVADVATS